MELNKEEIQEIKYLRMCQIWHIPMNQQMWDRLKCLSKKEFHNCCPNPECEGHTGTEQEYSCPKCKCVLFKDTRA